MPLQHWQAGRGQDGQGAWRPGAGPRRATVQDAVAGAGEGGAAPSPRRRPPSSRGFDAGPEPRLFSAGPSGKLGALGEHRGGAAGASSTMRGTSSAPPFPLPFRPPSCHRKCFPCFPSQNWKRVWRSFIPPSTIIYKRTERRWAAGIGGCCSPSLGPNLPFPFFLTPHLFAPVSRDPVCTISPPQKPVTDKNGGVILLVNFISFGQQLRAASRNSSWGAGAESFGQPNPPCVAITHWKASCPASGSAQPCR